MNSLFECLILWNFAATGYTEYYFDEKSGKVSRYTTLSAVIALRFLLFYTLGSLFGESIRHVEHWNVPKITLLKQILKPSRRLSDKISREEV